MNRDTLIEFFEHDTTVVITKDQNNADGEHTTWGRIIAVPEGMFATRGYSFNVRVGTEIPWAAEKVAELDRNRTGTAFTYLACTDVCGPHLHQFDGCRILQTASGRKRASRAD